MTPKKLQLPDRWNAALNKVCIRVSADRAAIYRKCMEELVQALQGSTDLNVASSLAGRLGTYHRTMWNGVHRELCPNIPPIGRRELWVSFSPGDLGTKIKPLRAPDPSGYWAGLKQRDIETVRLKRLREVGAPEITADSYVHRALLAESPTGEQRLLSFHHRSTMLNEPGQEPSAFMAEVRTEESWGAYGDWTHQLIPLNQKDASIGIIKQTELLREFSQWDEAIDTLGAQNIFNRSPKSKSQVTVARLINAQILAERASSGLLTYNHADKPGEKTKVEFKFSGEGQAAFVKASSKEKAERVVELAAQWQSEVIAPLLAAGQKLCAGGTALKSAGEVKEAQVAYLIREPALAAWYLINEKYPKEARIFPGEFLKKVHDTKREIPEEPLLLLGPDGALTFLLAVYNHQKSSKRNEAIPYLPAWL